MALTPQQRLFLDKYVSLRRNFLTKGGKTERSNNFAKMRESLQSALLLAPPGLPQRGEFVQAMRLADVLGEKLKFNRAAQAMAKILGDLGEAIRNYKPSEDPTGSQPVSEKDVKGLQSRLEKLLADEKLDDPQVSLLVHELDYPIEQAKEILDMEVVSQNHFNQAQGFVDEIEGKTERIFLHRDRIKARRNKLEKYLKLAEERDDITSTEGFTNLQKEAKNLLVIEPWSSIEESSGTALHLKLMLALANGSQMQQHDFKKGNFEMVVGVRRKTSDKKAPGFKMIMKPAKFEIAVDGFKPGGGATREAMGSVLGDELQRQMGFELHVPETRVVTLEGRDMGDSLVQETGESKKGKKFKKSFDEDEKVVTSVQSYEDGCDTIGTRAQKEGLSTREIEDHGEGLVLDKLKVPKREIQQMAVFDLISLHMDRHSGNMLLNEDNQLVPIDHGNIMPTKTGLRQRSGYISSQSAVLAQSKAAKEPLSPELLERIEQLDIDQLMVSMHDEHKQMKIENDGIDVSDLNDGLVNVRRSSEFLKFAAKDLTLAQIYDAYSQLQDLIFFSTEKDKIKCFGTAVNAMKLRAQSLEMLDVFLDIDPTNRDGAAPKRVLESLRALGWFLGGSIRAGSGNERLRQHQPARCLEILSKRETSDLSEDMDERFQQLGGRDAALRLGFACDDKNIRLQTSTVASIVQGLELHYALTGRRPTAS